MHKISIAEQILARKGKQFLQYEPNNQANKKKMKRREQKIEIKRPNFFLVPHKLIMHHLLPFYSQRQKNGTKHDSFTNQDADFFLYFSNKKFNQRWS